MLPTVNGPRTEPNPLSAEEMQLKIARLELENYQLRAKLGMQVPKIANVQATPAAVYNWREKIRALQEEQGERGCHLMAESNERNQEIMRKFMEIFNYTPDSDKKELLKQSFLPETWSDYGDKRRNTALPLHSVAFLADDAALEKLKPFLTAQDVKLRGPYNATLLHMIVAGIDQAASVGSPAKCAKIFLSMDPNLKNGRNSFDSRPIDYANCVYPSGGRSEQLRELKQVLEG